MQLKYCSTKPRSKSKKLKLKLINTRRPMKHSLSKKKTGMPPKLPELLPKENNSPTISRLPMKSSPNLPPTMLKHLRH
jgi:hypothetical protein